MMRAEPVAVDDARALAELADVLDGAARIAVISGAGCSTGSGIADYRAPDGSWKRPPPIQQQDFLRSEQTRRRYWARSTAGWPTVARARPNAAHRSLARWERQGRLTGVITQNVDGLHQQAGQQRLLELHGGLARVVCLDCGAAMPRAGLQERLLRENPVLREIVAEAGPDGDATFASDLDLDAIRVPGCAGCGGILKPDVVFYGDTVPKDRVAEGHAMIEAADALLIVGSSLMVYSSFRFCRRAHELGIPIVAVNRGVTRADAWLVAKVERDCARVLPGLVRMPAEAQVTAASRGSRGGAAPPAAE